MAQILIRFGWVLILIGGVLLGVGKIPWLGRLPGDILIQRKNVTFYFPLATSLLVSVIFSIFFWLIYRR